MLSPRLAATAACLTAGAALAQENVPTIAEVDVEVDLSNVDANALDFWPRIERDLADTVIAVADPMLSDSGYVVDVQIADISLEGLAVLPETGEFNHLEGWVYVREAEGEAPVKSEQIVLDAEAYVPGGNSEFHIIPGRPDFYIALVNVFATRVVEEVAELGS